MKLNNKGFAITTIIYGTLILFLLLLASLLGMMSTHKLRIYKLKDQTIEIIDNKELECIITATIDGYTINDTYGEKLVIAIKTNKSNVTYSWDNGTTWGTKSNDVITKEGEIKVQVKDKRSNTATCNAIVEKKTFYQYNTCSQCKSCSGCNGGTYIDGSCYSNPAIPGAAICTGGSVYWANGICYLNKYSPTKYNNNCSVCGCNAWNTTDNTWYETSAGTSNKSTKKNRTTKTVYRIKYT